MNTEVIVAELKFKAVRSSGAGGQHVNKVSSKMELTFDVENSEGISLEEKELLKLKLSSYRSTRSNWCIELTFDASGFTISKNCARNKLIVG